MPLYQFFKAFPLYRIVASLPLFTFLFSALLYSRVFRGWSPPTRVWRLAAAVCSAFACVLVLAYLVLPVISEESEAQIMSASFHAISGAPVYPALDSAQQYGLLYGPVIFLSLIPGYMLLGGSLFAAKLVGSAAFFLTLASIYGVVRVYAGRGESLVAIGCVCLVALRFGFVSFWVHPDPLLCLMAVFPLWAILRKQGWAAVAASGVCLALAFDLKITGFLYLLAPFALLFIKRGMKATASALLIAAGLIPLPFLLPAISLRPYLEVLRIAAHHGIDGDLLSRDLQNSVLLAVPVLVFLFRGKKLGHDTRVFLIALAVAMLGISILAAKPGGGSHHLLPFLGQIVLGYFWLRSERSEPVSNTPFARLALPWVLTIGFYTLSSFINNAGFLSTFRSVPQSLSAQLEIRRMEEKFKGHTMEMGYSDARDDKRAAFRPLLVFAGNPYTLDKSAESDLQFGGHEIPAATRDYMDRCGTEYWLIPSGAKPFNTPNGYRPESPIYDKTFQDSFQKHYRRVVSLREYDVWGCLAQPDSRLSEKPKAAN